MAYYPTILGYKPFYIQTCEDYDAVNVMTEYGMIVKAHPYPLLPQPKAPYNNDWKDENGDDEFVSPLFYEAEEIAYDVVIKTFTTDDESAETILRHQMDEFFAKIHCGEFGFYDAYTGIGRRKVRYAGYKEDSFKAKDNWARAIFTLKFKVNDPITRMVLVDGRITREDCNGED